MFAASTVLRSGQRRRLRTAHEHRCVSLGAEPRPPQLVRNAQHRSCHGIALRGAGRDDRPVGWFATHDFAMLYRFGERNLHRFLPPLLSPPLAAVVRGCHVLRCGAWFGRAGHSTMTPAACTLRDPAAAADRLRSGAQAVDAGDRAPLFLRAAAPAVRQTRSLRGVSHIASPARPGKMQACPTIC